MRNRLRIKPFLNRVDIPWLVTVLWEKRFGGPKEATKLIDNIMEFLNSDKNQWDSYEFGDQRFGQYMYNVGFEFFDLIYHKEEPDILMLCGYEETESYGWISNMDKYKHPIDPVFRFVDELNDDHLVSMISEANLGTRLYSTHMLQLFEKELARRGFDSKKYKVTDAGWSKQAKMIFNEMTRRL